MDGKCQIERRSVPSSSFDFFLFQELKLRKWNGMDELVSKINKNQFWLDASRLFFTTPHGHVRRDQRPRTN